jgi:4a-hydroxytetrahydrobiopterin dehydratase
MTRLTGQQTADEGLDGWAQLLGGLQTRLLTQDFATGLAVVDAIGAVAEEMNHHPDLAISWNTVDVTLSTHSEGGLTDNDFELARHIDDLA